MLMETSTAEGERVRWQIRFFSIWMAQAVSLLGSRLVQFALIWWLTETSGSAIVLAGATIVGMLPQIVLGPFAGALVDRWNRRMVMIVADGVIALATVFLALLYALEVVQIWHIYVLMFVRSAGGAFHWPAMQASTTLMVPRQQLSRIAGLNQTLFGAINIISPPLGALLLEILPIQSILAIDVGTAMLAITPLLFVHIPQPQRKETPETAQPSVVADLREGLRFVWDWLGLMLLLVVATMINMLVSPAMSLLPLMVNDHFQGGPPEFAALQSAFGIGVVIGGITLTVWGGFKRRIVTSLSAVTMMGVGITAVGLVPANAFALAAAAFFLGGIMNPIANGSLMAIIQASVPPEMQGRVFTLIGSGAAAASPLGLLVAGPVADALGVSTWFLIGGSAMIIMGAGAFFVPPIMRIEDKATETGVAYAG